MSEVNALRFNSRAGKFQLILARHISKGSRKRMSFHKLQTGVHLERFLYVILAGISCDPNQVLPGASASHRRGIESAGAWSAGGFAAAVMACRPHPIHSADLLHTYISMWL